MEPFTLRHNKALVEKRIKVSLSTSLRERVWQTISVYNESWQETDDRNWTSSTNHLEKTESKLKRLLGKSELSAKTPDGLKTGMEAYFKEGYPSNVLEVVEQFYEELQDENRYVFERKINEAMLAFGCPWRLSNGTFFCVDSEFFADLLDGVRRQFRQHGFEGALDELREAQEALSDNRHKDAIHAASKSYESTLKAIVGSRGTASGLIATFRDGYLDDIPEDHAKAISSAVLKSLPTLRNELGGHGQGSSVVTVPKSYATLAVHLAAALNYFLVEQKLAKNPAESAAVAEAGDADEILDDDIPF